MKMGKARRSPVKYVVVDAFTDREFKGNPAAVCLLDPEQDADDEWLQSIATEFNLSETCFLTPLPNNTIRFHLRWFTPLSEVDLCGHATLAAAHYCFTSNLVNGNTIEFSTLSGILTAKKVVEPKAQASLGCENRESEEQPFFIELDFPATPSTDSDCNANKTPLVSEALGGVTIVELKKTASDDLIALLPSAEAVMDVQPQIEMIQKCPGRGLFITAAAPPGSRFDFFSRVFFPKLGINEDPVCGSAHCALAPYWSNKLHKCNFLAYQASPRSGILKLDLDEQNNRVHLQGTTVTVMEGIIVV